MKNVTLKIFPNVEKKSKKNQTIPVYLRVMVNGKKAEAKIPNVKIELKELSLWNPILSCMNDPNSKVNKTIAAVKYNFDELIAKNIYEKTTLNANFIRDYLIGADLNECKEYVIKYFKEYYVNVVFPSSQWSKATKKIYNKSINHFSNFLIHNKLSQLTFSEVKITLGMNFKNYLTSTIENVKINGEITTKNGLSNDSAAQVVKKIRSIFNVAKDEEKLQINPLDKIRFTFNRRSSKNLKIFEIKKLYDVDLSHRPSLEICRDLFLFQVFSGMAFCDMMNLKPNQITNITPEKLHFSYFRMKTNVEAKVIVNNYLQELINKFKQHPYTKIKGTVVPNINLAEINSRLKILADMFNLSLPDLSSHIGRHCFRQFIDEAEIEHSWTIYKMMGWSYNDNINSKYSNGNDKLLLKANEKLEEYFDSNLK
jgi:site-specific recombinase XerD